jgi:hypothetical protein
MAVNIRCLLSWAKRLDHQFSIQLRRQASQTLLRGILLSFSVGRSPEPEPRRPGEICNPDYICLASPVYIPTSELFLSNLLLEGVE